MLVDLNNTNKTSHQVVEAEVVPQGLALEVVALRLWFHPLQIRCHRRRRQ